MTVALDLDVHRTPADGTTPRAHQAVWMVAWSSATAEEENQTEESDRQRCSHTLAANDRSEAPPGNSASSGMLMSDYRS